ncbi:hypothetical protein CON64_22660 [Bacillus pseudomycoides]|nr:hypothetical protein CON64_22660 [Bacillus pseudomycoides]
MKSTIRNKEQVEEAIDFSVINNLLPDKISLTDIDGAIERNGHVLLLEKKMHKMRFNMGQHMLLTSQVLKNQTHVIYYCVQGEKILRADFYPSQIKKPEDILKVQTYESSYEEIAESIHDWYKWADAQPKIKGLSSAVWKYCRGIREEEEAA